MTLIYDRLNGWHGPHGMSVAEAYDGDEEETRELVPEPCVACGKNHTNLNWLGECPDCEQERKDRLSELT